MNLKKEKRHFHKKVGLILCGFFLAWNTINAQYSLGTTGLLNIPTADMQETGTVMAGGNFLPKEITPLAFNYNTGNYYVNLTFFSFMELTFRETLFKTGYMSSKKKFNQQDRSYTIRIRAFKEGYLIPAVVFGVNDPLADKGGNYFQSYYAVATKGFSLGGNNRLAASVGYYIPGKVKDDNQKYSNAYDGFFGGISFTPSFYRDLKIMAEYDVQGINMGAAVRLWNHFSIHAFVHDFKAVSGGIRYECRLIY